MSAAPDVLKSVQGIRNLMLEGTGLNAQVASILTGAEVNLTIEGASTLTLTLHDTDRKVLRSGILDSRITAQVDDFGFELVQVRKSDDDLSVIFEDLPVVALRRHDEPLKVAAGTTNHLEFARRLVAEEPWIQFRYGPGAKVETAKVELTRGKPASDQPEEREDSWTALGRIADERGWRRWAVRNQVVYVPETYMFLGDPEYVLEENARQGVERINFDYDSGKPVGTVTVTARAGRWQIPVGVCVEVRGCGPANGKWLVSSIQRSLFSLLLTITLTQPRPELPEPDPPPAPTAADLGPSEGSSASPVTDSGTPSGPPGKGSWEGDTAGIWLWPVQGPVTSPFGMRDGKLHAGLDIAVPIGTPVHASADGTVIHAGAASGYGIAVYITHPLGSWGHKPGRLITRYGHLSSVQCRRGQPVRQGDVIAKSGNTGHSTGPHCHFEMRPNDQPVDPRNYLKGNYAQPKVKVR